jgi:hypothetical protein
MIAFSAPCFVLSGMDGKIEFCVKLFKSATETIEMLCEAFEWHSHFKASQVSVEDDERSRHPSISKTTENVENISELIHEDCQ